MQDDEQKRPRDDDQPSWASRPERSTRVVLAHQQARPDLLVMNVDMPLHDGVTATRAVRAASPYTRVLLVGEVHDFRLLRDLAAAGAAGLAGWMRRLAVRGRRGSDEAFEQPPAPDRLQTHCPQRGNAGEQNEVGAGQWLQVEHAA
jgi:CheY-like chemotaxis protein